MAGLPGWSSVATSVFGSNNIAGLPLLSPEKVNAQRVGGGVTVGVTAGVSVGLRAGGAS
ncbi:MAG: hypothetical protein GX589_02660 [Deltaproteobacteria bacterium]|nr:hypothetical protein [Deltaproteobacteria bacterium]